MFWDNSEGIPIAGAIWFLTAMFFVNSIYCIIDTILKKKATLHLVVFLITLWGCIASQILPFRLPWSMNAAFVGIGFFHIARMVSVRMKTMLKEKLRIQTVLIAVVIFLVCSILSLINGTVNMREGNYAVIPLFWVIALGITVSGIFISRQCETRFNNFLMFSIVSKIGKNSMAYLCLNQLFIMFYMKLVQIISLPHIVSSFLVLLMTTASIYLIDYVVEKSSLKIIFGR